MVVCIIAMFVFGFLSLFSAKYRPLAKEAFRCAFLKLTFRPCEAKLDEKIKAGIVGSLLEKSPGTARFVNRHFEAISFVFTLLFIASLAYSAYGIYNLAVYGTCDPLNPEGCILKSESASKDASLPSGVACTITADFAEFYGAECPVCMKMAPILAEVEAETGAKFERLEIWNNDSNARMMQIHYPEIKRDCGPVVGVPTFLSVRNKKAICGELTKGQLEKFVLENK